MSKKFERFTNHQVPQIESREETQDIDDELDSILKDLEQPSIVDEDGLPKLVSETANEVNARLDSKRLTQLQSESIKQVVTKAKVAVSELNPGEDDARIEKLNAQIRKLEKALDESNEQLKLILPVSGYAINTKVSKVKVTQCRPHPLNTRTLSDHNRQTLSSRMTSFRRQGQLEPALAIPCPIHNDNYLIVDGAGRLKTWEFLQQDYPGEYDGNVFTIRCADIPEQDIRALSKTRNESEPMSDWNLAQVYQSMIDDGVYADMKTLCEAEGLVYKTWVAKIHLAKVPSKYIDLFVKSADVPKTLPKKVTQWEKLLGRDKSKQKQFNSLLDQMIKETQAFVTGETDKAPYPIEAGNATVLIKKLNDLVMSFEKKVAIPKEKAIEIDNSALKGTAKKDRNGRYSVKLEKCDDDTFAKILEFLQSL